jgi:outer membrane protein TolC
VRADAKSWRHGWWIAGVVASLTACAPVRGLTRPEGNGGWSEERRARELERVASVAGVDFGSGNAAGAADPASLDDVPHTIDLATALDLSARNNRRIIEQQNDVAIAGARVSETRAQLLPTLQARGRYTWYSDPLTNSVTIPGGGGATATIMVRDDEEGVVNGTALLALDLSGELRHELAAAQAGYRGEQARLWATTLGQQAAVVRAYFELLEARRLREVTEQTMAVRKEQLDDAQSRFDAGRLMKNELLVVQVALRNSEQEIRRRNLAIERARWSLNQTIGIEVNAPTEAVDVSAPPQLPQADEALRLAFAHNPLLRSLVEEQQRLEATATALARGRFPRFSAGGAVDYTTSDILEPQDMESGFVGFDWDPASLRREAEISRAEIAAKQNRTRIERQLRELEQAVRSSRDAVEERLSALETADTAVIQAEENLRIRREQFGVGRATSDDVLDAQALLTLERATLATALYQAHIRRAELQQLIGLPLEDALPIER